MDADLQSLIAKTDGIVRQQAAERATREVLAKAQREQNRRDCPQHTAYVELFENQFGQVKTLRVSEGGKTLGTPCTEKWVGW